MDKCPDCEAELIFEFNGDNQMVTNCPCGFTFSYYVYIPEINLQSSTERITIFKALKVPIWKRFWNWITRKEPKIFIIDPDEEPLDLFPSLKDDDFELDYQGNIKLKVKGDRVPFDVITPAEVYAYEKDCTTRTKI